MKFVREKGDPAGSGIGPKIQGARFLTPKEQTKKIGYLSCFLVIGSALAHAAAFPWLVESLGAMTRVFIMPSLFLAAWFWGVPGGVAAAVAALLLNWALFSGHAQPWQNWVAGFLASLALVVIVGYLSDLRRKLAAQLGKTREAEEALAEAYLSMERLADRRGEELTLTQQALDSEIGQRKAAQDEAENLEALYRAYMDLSPDPIFILDLAGNYLDANPAGEKITGYSREELLSMHYLDAHAPEDRERMEPLFKTVVEQGRLQAELPYVRKNGERFYMSISVARVLGNRLMGFGQDTTERRRAEEAIKEKEATYRSIFDSSGEGIMVIRHVIEECNQAVAKMLKLAPEQIIGRLPSDFAPPGREEEYRQHQARVWREVMEHGTQSFYWRCVDANGEPVEMEATLSAVTIKGERAILAVGRDVTAQRAARRERRILERDLLQSQKMEALGSLSGGIAHDFNNLLAVIMGYAEHGLAAAGRESRAGRDLAGIVAASKKAKDLVGHILAFSRKVETHNRDLDLNQAVAEALDMLGRTLPKSLELSFSPCPGPALLHADLAQLEQLVFNLVTNAADSMPQGGRIELSTSSQNLDKALPLPGGRLEAGDYLVLSVADQGAGISQEAMAHIFEPFFTTKEPGRGTGLGLSTVYGIAAGLKGGVDCQSKPGQGSVFRVFLRRPAGPVEESQTPTAQPASPAGGKESLLLVDDEPELRELFGELLGDHGYRVQTAASGEEALAVYGREGKEIDLVIMDLGMPGMGGEACFRALKEIDPGVKVVIASGYGLAAGAHRLLEEGALGFLGKPVGVRDMLAMVREALDSEGQRPAR